MLLKGSQKIIKFKDKAPRFQNQLLAAFLMQQSSDLWKYRWTKWFSSRSMTQRSWYATLEITSKLSSKTSMDYLSYLMRITSR